MRYIIFVLLFCSNWPILSQSSIKIDIDDKSLDKLYIESDSTLTTEFQRFAIDLFKKGGKLKDSIFMNKDFHTVGVCLIYKLKDEIKQDIELTLYALSYKDLGTKNFHKSIYFGKVREGLSNFYVDHDTDEQIAAIDEAVTSYLKFDSIPRTSLAYQFARTYTIDDEYYEAYFKTDKHSTVIIGSSYAYLRQNGNYIIQIEGFPDKALDEDTEELYVTDFFLNDWFAISVFIIDDSDNKAYNTIFKY
ncbi:hypothetical protein [Psychroserpens jangbogonensis]|uniref:hypothetical protein n=1 Tax=Psychroserpens jangbogonensis TaxID=1484460 RepID=UPI00053EAFD8|nr:hypothetical protein [Psychroserpens jangbogonensis]